MSGPEQIWKRTTNFLSALFKTASALATVLTILAFLGLSTAILGVKDRALSFALIGAGIIVFTGVVFILFHTMLRNVIPTTTSNHTDSSAHLSPSSLNEHNQLDKTTTVLPAVLKTETPRIDTTVYPPPPSAARQGEGDVVILRKEIVYEYLPDGKTMYQRKYLKIQSLRENLTVFTDRYRWSGNGTCDLKALTKGFEVTNQYKDYEGTWTYFDVRFPYPLHLGEMYEFTIEWTLIDEESTALPFLSTMIDRETKYLLLEVKLPQELAPTRATFHEFTNYIDTLPSSTKPIQWSPATKSIRHEVMVPEKYHKYNIRWYKN